MGSPQGDRIAIDLARASLGEEIEPPDATTRVDSITQPLVLVSGELDISHIVERRDKPEATLPLKFLSALFSEDQSLDDQ